jgi:hypothetical protein
VAVCLSVHERFTKAIGNQGQSIHSLPPTDGWTDGADEPGIGTIYINYQQDDWSEWLSLAEFTYNNQEHSVTKCSPFFANYGRHLNKGTNQNLQVKSQSAIELAKQMQGIHEEVGAAISHAQRLMKTQYDK